MNIKISKEEADFLFNLDNEKHIFGSKLYGVNKEGSDTDILVVYKSFHASSDLFYPNYHQFQFDDKDNNTQYVFTSYEQFFKNMFSGDSTINVDIVMFHDIGFVRENSFNSDKLNMCRTYNIIKSFLGMAKRDLKLIKGGKNKLFHINRGLYCAEQLLANKLPKISEIGKLDETDISVLSKKQISLREECNLMFDNGSLSMFPLNPVIIPINSLEKKLVHSNNIKNFTY